MHSSNNKVNVVKTLKVRGLVTRNSEWTKAKKAANRSARRVGRQDLAVNGLDEDFEPAEFKVLTIWDLF